VYNALQLEDSLWTGLTDQQINTPMGVTAENLAEKYDITRQQCDEFAVLSNQRWKAGLPHLLLTTITASFSALTSLVG